MAKVKYSALMSDMRGKLNGSVASRNKAGNYLRTKVTPLNPQTTAQVLARSTLATFSQGWRGLTQEQRDAFIAVTDQWSKTNVFGDIVNPSGSALYTRLNINIRLAGGVPIVVPPSPQGVASLSELTVDAAFTGQAMQIGFLASPVPAGLVMYVEATPMLSPGIANAKSKFRHIVSLPATTATGEDIATAYIAKFGALVAGQKFFLRAKLIRKTTGEVSQELSVAGFVAI